MSDSLPEIIPYQDRVQNVVNYVIANSDTSTKKNTVLEHIETSSISMKIRDYTIGGSARRDFIKDVLLGLKGKIRIKAK
jgi:hypothetical protein